MLCVFDTENCECGVGVGVNDNILSETLQVVGLTDSAVIVLRLQKITVNLCVCDIEDTTQASCVKKKSVNLCENN